MADEVKTEEVVKTEPEEVKIENQPETEVKETLPSIDKNKEYKGTDVLKLVSIASKNTALNVKNQLYPEIDRQKAKLLELENTLKTANEKDKEKIMIEKAEVEKQNKELAEQLAKVNEQLKAVAEKTSEIEKKSSEKELNDHRSKLLAENKGSIVDELVTGKTIEELNASIEKAKAKYKEIEEGVRGKLNLPKAPTPEEIEIQNKPVNVDRIDVTNGRVVNDYRKNRNTLREEIYRKEGFPI